MQWLSGLLGRFSPLPRRALLRVALLMGPLTLLVLGAKIAKLHRLAKVITWDRVVAALSWDLLFLVSLGLLFLMWLSFTRGVVRKIGVVLLHLTVLMCFGLAVLEHVFFIVTGTVADWYMLKYMMEQIGNLKQVLISHVKLFHIGLFAVLLLINLAPIWIEDWAKLQAWLDREQTQPSRWAWQSGQWLGVCVALVVMFPGQRFLPNDTLPLGQNTVLDLTQKMWGDFTAAQPVNEKLLQLPKGKWLFDTTQLKTKATTPKPKKNIVVFVLESTRARSITPYNPNLKTMPFLAKIARQSKLVESMHAVIPHTSKALVPILCGIYPRVTIRITEGLLGGLPARCLPKLLKDQGYISAFFQSATVKFEGRSQLIENMGFDLLRGHEDMKTSGFAKTNYFGYEDQMMAKPSLAWVDKVRQQKKPFLLTYLTLVSHHTYTTPPNFETKPYTKSTDPEFNKYLNSLRYIDNFLGRMFADFKKRGMYKDTIFLFIGDHGEAFDEHKRRQHDNVMWQEGLRVPMIIFDPSNPQHERIQGLRQQVDFLPTVLDLLGLKAIDGKLPGYSVLQPPRPDRKLFFSCWYERQCMARLHRNQKVIYHYNRRSMEVYQLDQDPKERQNLLASNVLSPKALAQAQREMRDWRDRVNALYNTSSKMRVERDVSKKAFKPSLPIKVKLGPFVEIAGIDLHTPKLVPGQSVDITYIFKVMRKIPRGWKLFFHVTLLKPYKFINADHIPVGGAHPIEAWEAKTYIRDRHKVRIPANFPVGGKIRVMLGMWSKGKPRQPLLGTHGPFRDAGQRNLIIAEIPLVSGK